MLRPAARSAWVARWSGLLAIASQRPSAATLLCQCVRAARGPCRRVSAFLGMPGDTQGCAGCQPPSPTLKPEWCRPLAAHHPTRENISDDLNVFPWENLGGDGCPAFAANSSSSSFKRDCAGPQQAGAGHAARWSPRTTSRRLQGHVAGTRGKCKRRRCSNITRKEVESSRNSGQAAVRTLAAKLACLKPKQSPGRGI